MAKITKAQIKEELDKKGISYSSQSTRDELEDLLEKSEEEQARVESSSPKPKKAEKIKTAYYNGIPVVKTKEVKDKEGNPQVKISLVNGEVKVVPPEIYQENSTYK